MGKMRYKNRLKYGLVLLGFLFWGLSVFYGKMQLHNMQSVGIRFEESAVTSSLFETMWKEESQNITSMAAYKKIGKVYVNNDLNQAVLCNAYNVNGDVSLIFTDRLLYGHYPMREDRDVCVITKKAAGKIWGSVNVAGLSLTYNNKKFLVVGVIDNDYDIILFQQADLLSSFSNMEIVYKNQSNAGFNAAELLRKYGISSDYTIVDFVLMKEFMKLVYLLPGFILVFILIIRGIRTCKKYEGTPLYKGIFALIFLFVVILLLKYCGFGMHVPDSLLPNRWSDFDFYTNKWKEIKNGYLQIQQLPLQFTDIKLKYNSIASLFYSFISSICVMKIRKIKFNDPLNTAIFTSVCCFLGLTLLRMVHMEIKPPVAFIVMPYVYIFISIFLVKINGMALTKDK